MAAGALDEDFYLYGDQGKLQRFEVPLKHEKKLAYCPRVVLKSPEDKSDKARLPITENGTERYVV